MLLHLPKFQDVGVQDAVVNSQGATIMDALSRQGVDHYRNFVVEVCDGRPTNIQPAYIALNLACWPSLEKLFKDPTTKVDTPKTLAEIAPFI